jgi:hypothetical protein
MTGPQHCRTAEELAAKASEYLGQGDGQDSAAVWAAVAQAMRRSRRTPPSPQRRPPGRRRRPVSARRQLRRRPHRDVCQLPRT